MKIFFAVVLLLAPRAYGEMALCERTIGQMVGPYAVICKELLKSQSFRATCEKVSDANRIKCDGLEPSGPFDVRKDLLVDCGQNFYLGAKDSVVELKDLAVHGAKLVGSAGKAVLYSILPGSAHAAAKDVEIMRAAAREMIVSDDAGAYGAHTVTDEGEFKALMKASLSKDFWKNMGNEISAFLRETLPQYWCLSPQAQNAYTCYVGGSLIGGGAAIKGVVLSLKGTSKAAKLLKQFEKTQGGAR